jgi:UDP-2,3-diacylglucosamine hydrolase
MINKKIYFVSDFHLGTPSKLDSKERELRVVRWLDSIKNDAQAIYLLGDIFDFWYEYKYVVPKGYLHLLGKLAELRSLNIPIYFFRGNHDMWMFKYFEEELGIPIYDNPISKEISGKRFYIGHGDGLGPKQLSFKLLRKIFRNKFFQWVFTLFNPNFTFGIAHFWSRSSRKQHPSNPQFLGKEKEWLVLYCEKKLKTAQHDFFIFGHRHLTIDYTLSDGKSRYINTGEWLNTNSYAVFDGENMEIGFFENEQGIIYA